MNMKKLLSNELPQELRELLHPDFIANEKEYWNVREILMKEYFGKWLAFHKGKVVAVSDRIFDVTKAVGKYGCYAFITKVGEEDLEFKVRRSEFDYRTEDISVPIPQAQVTYQNFDKTASKIFFDVIPDTGADICLLPMSECQAIRLFYSPCITYRLRGIGAPATANLLFQGYEDSFTS